MVAPDEPVLVRLRSRRSAHGFVDEDTDIWAPSGALLASTRQMRAVRPFDLTTPSG